MTSPKTKDIEKAYMFYAMLEWKIYVTEEQRFKIEQRIFDNLGEGFNGVEVLE